MDMKTNDVPFDSKGQQLSQPLLDGQQETSEPADNWESDLNTMYKKKKDKKGGGTPRDRQDEDDGLQIIDPQTREQSSEIKKANEVDFVEVVRDLKFPKSMVYGVYIYVFILNITVNLDHGAMPAALIDISNDVRFSNQQMGTLGSLVFFGLFIGTLNASFLFYRLKYKTIIIGTLVLNGISLYLFTVKSNFYCMCISRFIAGFCQIFITIYVPLYVDAYSSQKSKIYLLSIAMLCPTIGVVFGYGMTSYIINRGGVWKTIYKAYWWQSFRIQTWLNWLTAVLALFIPGKYLNIDEAVQEKRNYLKHMQEELKEKSSQAEVGGTAQTFSPKKQTEAQQSETGQYMNEFSSTQSNDSNHEDINKMSDIQSMYLLSKNRPFMYLTLGNCVLFFIVSGIQYWVTYYFVKNLHVPQEKGPLYFAVVVLSAPITGAILSGPYSNYWGGIYSKKIVPAIMMLIIPAILSALPIPLVDNVHAALTLFWFLLFFGAMILPILTGVILTKVEPEIRPRANSIANLFYELLGYFPAPILYGYACQIEGSGESRAGMALLMCSTLLMPVFIALAIFLENKEELKKQKPNDVICENEEKQ